MALKNIEFFDIFAGYIFKELYQSFPIPLIIETETMIRSIPKTLLSIETGNEMLIFSETMFWLSDSGFISIESPGRPSLSMNLEPFTYFHHVTLTAKGLEVMKRVPKSLRRENSIGEDIIEAAKSGVKSKISDLVTVALSQMI